MARTNRELELFEFEGQLSIDEEEETLEEEDEALEAQEEDEGDWFPSPELLVIRIQFNAGSWDRLIFRAQIDLDRIADQYNLERARQLRRVFANFVSVPEADLCLSETGDVMRYVWLASEFADRQLTQASVCYAELSEIALRLEPAICREAPSERTLGQQRRFLAPHRMRMEPDLLLARTAIKESGQGAKMPRPRTIE
jgi:hypothetical protein